MMCAAYERILLSEDVPFTNRCYTPRFREGTWSTIRGSVGCGCDSARLEGEAASSQTRIRWHLCARRATL